MTTDQICLLIALITFAIVAAGMVWAIRAICIEVKARENELQERQREEWRERLTRALQENLNGKDDFDHG